MRQAPASIGVKKVTMDKANPINKKARYMCFFAFGISRHFLGLKTPSIIALNNVQINNRLAATMCQ